MLLTSLAERRNSPSSGRPSTSSAIAWPRSPLATAPTARVTSVVGQTRSSIRVLSAVISSAQPPTAPGTRMRSLSLPSLPTTRLTRAVSAPRAHRQDVVEDIGDLALDADQVGRHARAEVAVLEAQQRGQQVVEEADRAGRAGGGRVSVASAGGFDGRGHAPLP